MKTICIYHTRSGYSKSIAEKIANETGAELLCITDGKDRSGFFGYIAAAIVGLKKTLPVLTPYKTELPLEEYERMIFVAPVWCENVSPIMRSFVKSNAEKLNGELYFVLTSMSGITYEEKANELFSGIGKKINTFLPVKTHKNDWNKDINQIIEKLK